MRRLAQAFTISLLCLAASCDLILEHSKAHDAPAPSGETHQPAPAPAPRPYAHLPQRTSFTTKASTELKPGCYVGDFVLGCAQLRVKGAGIDQTVIDGNLVIDTQCVVSNLTVTGDVIFKGNQGSLENVDFLGRVVDHGVQNRY